MGDFLTGLGAFLTVLAALAFVLFCAYILLHWMGKNTNIGAAGANLKIIERLNVGREKSLMIVQVGEKALLIGMSDGAVECLAELGDAEQYIAKSNKSREKMDFASILQKTIKNRSPKQHKQEDTGIEDNKQ